jgi:acetyl-CoA carboxylase carboxyl transferase subunit alpha
MKDGYFSWEGEIRECDSQISALEDLSRKRGICYDTEISRIDKDRARELRRLYSDLAGFQTVEVARHPGRPIMSDYLENLVADFREIHGDRCFGDDRSIVCGLGKIGRKKYLIVGHNKGRTTKEKIKYNFGSPHPEGYRKALRLMKFAEKFGIPVITLIDTPGAYPGIEAEERGQAYAIAKNLYEMSKLSVPIISVVIGEGGSGGALGIGVCDKFAMLQHSYFSVISPEGCAAILWKKAMQENIIEAAEALKLQSKYLLKLGLIDDVIPEPIGGAHRNHYETFQNVKHYIKKATAQLSRISIEELLNQRYQKWRSFGNETMRIKKGKRTFRFSGNGVVNKKRNK